MACAVRVIVYNADETFGPELRAALLRHDGLKIAAEVDEAVLLPQAVEQFPCELLVANLDPLPESVLPMLSQVAAANPNLAIFAFSESGDGKLILAAMRSGIREFITRPIEPAVLQEAIGKVAERNNGADQNGQLITVIGSAGGVGATTIAVNLAVELKALTNGRVTVVDLDHRFGQVATFMDVEPTYTMADLCESPEEVETQVLERTLVNHSSGVRVLSRPLHFVQADNITAAHCVGVLSALTAMNDYVIVDGPTRFDYGAKAVLDITDHNLMVLHTLVPAVRSVHRMLEGMMEVGYNFDRMKLVCNREGGDSGGISPEDVAATLNREIFGVIPCDSASVNAAINMGEPLNISAPKSKARAAIQALAMRIHDPDQAPEMDLGAGKKKGLLSKIF